MPRLTLTQVADNVHLAQTGLANWGVLTDGDEVTLVDAGYPGDHGRVLESLERVGRRVEDVRAIVVTHAHIDHIGTIPRLVEKTDAAVYLSEPETHHARREYLEQATERDVALESARSPRTLSWALRIVAVGAMKNVVLQEPLSCAPGVALDIPGRPVPVPTPGHTSGHNAYHLPGVGAVFVGDAMATAHPTTSGKGPQLLKSFFAHDADEAERTLDTIGALDGDLLLPGHGPVWRGSFARAVEQARGA
jgi:glyoxylase-like metal-dependent hydrolase (beta-lactamase superfamily II)